MSSSPSALANDMITPAPRCSGVATIFPPHPAQLDPQVLVLAQRRQYLAGDARGDFRTRLGRCAQPAVEQGFYEQLGGQDGGHGIAGQADYRLAVHQSQNDWMPWTHRYAVHQQAAQFLHNGGGIVLRPGGGPCVDYHQVIIGHRVFDLCRVSGRNRRVPEKTVGHDRPIPAPYRPASGY